MIVGAIGLWIVVLVTGGVGEVSTRSLLLFTAAGLIGTVGGRLTRFLAIEKVGATVTAAISSVTPLIASFLAILLLGESGAGKSMATVQCLLVGLGVIAEDVVFVEPRRLTVSGVPNYLHLRLETPRLLPPGLARRVRRSPVIERRGSGVRKYEVDLRATTSRRVRLPARLIAVVVLSRRKAARGASLVHDLPDRELLRMLEHDQPYGRSRPHWRTLRASLRRLPKFRLERGAAAADTANVLADLLARRA
jgi:uncharacterized membrane protein